MTRLCVPILGQSIEQMRANLDRAIALDAQTRMQVSNPLPPIMLELRLDGLEHSALSAVGPFIAECRASCPNEFIATCRIAAEGGGWHGDEQARMRIFTQAIAAGAQYVDIEYESWRTAPEVQAVIESLGRGGERTTRWICSKHNFQHTPDNLAGIFEQLATSPADIVKFACKADTITDAVRVLDALRGSAAKRPTIGLAMGEAGLIARVLAGKAGGFLTFAALETGQESAPGQVDLRQMRCLYRAESIEAATEVLGVIGCPVAHSMSPAIFNAAFAATDRDAVYLPLRVEPDYSAFAAFVDSCRANDWLSLRGCSVTIPHKANLLGYVREHGGRVEPLAERIGAANTLALASEPDNCVMAYNTDQAGALQALWDELGCGTDQLAGKKVAVLGAGGAARAIVAGLCAAGCRVIICNRTVERARELAADFGAELLEWQRRGELDSDIIVNCTSIGMWPNLDDTPLPESAFRNQPVVFDTIYNPLETRLLREARRHRCRTINGSHMFINQAARQYQIWFQAPPPLETMREILLKTLNLATQ